MYDMSFILYFLDHVILNTSVGTSNPQRVRGGSAVPESDIMQACRSVCTSQKNYPSSSTTMSL